MFAYLRCDAESAFIALRIAEEIYMDKNVYRYGKLQCTVRYIA